MARIDCRLGSANGATGGAQGCGEENRPGHAGDRGPVIGTYCISERPSRPIQTPPSSTDDLCRSVYQREPEKRHRVAVLRALRHNPRIASLTADRLGGPLVFYRLGNPIGYGLAKLKVKAPEITDADLRAQLQAEHGHVITEGGSWWCFAKMAEAERGGHIERLTSLTEIAERAANAAIERVRQASPIERRPALRTYDASPLPTALDENTGANDARFKVKATSAHKNRAEWGVHKADCTLAE